MKIGKDVAAQFKGLYIVHQNIPGKAAPVVTFNQHILFIPLRGEIKIEVADRKYSASPGQMLYLAPNVAHSFSSSSQSGERLIAMLGPKALKRGDMRGPGLKLPLNQLVKEVLFYLLLHPNTQNAKALVGVFSETLAEVFAQVPFSGALDQLEGQVMDPRVKQVLTLMRDSIGERIAIDDIAKGAGLSSRNLNRLVLRETGIQPRQWLINFRIDQAKELLKKPGASVTEVALAIGYGSLSQFIAAFRSRTGQLPSEYLKRG